VIYSPFTNWGAQASYDHLREYGVSTNREMWAHMLVQSANLAAEITPIAALTSMSNPAMISYGYRGIDAAKFGVAAAQADRLAFQRVSSRAYQIGSRALVGANAVMNAPYRIPASTTARLGRIGGRVGFRLIPGIGWAMLAYDVYDLLANQRLLGVNL
jgi:hypothetical protein